MKKRDKKTLILIALFLLFTHGSKYVHGMSVGGFDMEVGTGEYTGEYEESNTEEEITDRGGMPEEESNAQENADPTDMNIMEDENREEGEWAVNNEQEEADISNEIEAQYENWQDSDDTETVYYEENLQAESVREEEENIQEGDFVSIQEDISSAEAETDDPEVERKPVEEQISTPTPSLRAEKPTQVPDSTPTTVSNPVSTISPSARKLAPAYYDTGKEAQIQKEKQPQYRIKRKGNQIKVRICSEDSVQILSVRAGDQEISWYWKEGGIIARIKGRVPEVLEILSYTGGKKIWYNRMDLSKEQCYND